MIREYEYRMSQPLVVMVNALIKIKNFSKELTILIVKELIEDIGKISEIMMTSKGRDKIFSLM